MTNAFFIELPIRSRPQPRPRLGRGRRTYYPGEFDRYRRRVVAMLRSAWHTMGRPWVEPPLGIRLEFRGRKRGDLDNHLKAWLDLLERAFLWDDRHVYEIHAVWRESDDVGVRIEVFEFQGSLDLQ